MPYFVSFILLILLQSSFVRSQLIGEDRKYLMLEQVALERFRSTIQAMIKPLEDRIQRLEEENEQLQAKLNLIGTPSPLAGSLVDPLTSCPLSPYCDIPGLTCPVFYMDPDTLYQTGADTRYLSANKLVLSNRQQNSHNWPKGSAELSRYTGVRGSRSFRPPDKVYFEVGIDYQIFTSLSATNLLFEVAIATKTAISNSDYVGKQKGAWSVNAHHQSGYVNLFFKSGESPANSYILHQKRLSSSSAGTKVSLDIGLFVDTVNGIITVMDASENRKLYTFTGIDTSKALWPVFGVYQKPKTRVSLELRTRSAIDHLSCDIV